MGNLLMTWSEVMALVAAFVDDPAIAIVNTQGERETAAEFLQARRHYQDGSDRYTVHDGAIWLLGANGLVNMWALQPTAPVSTVEAGDVAGVPGMTWTRTDDDRLTFTRDGARWVFRCVAGFPHLVLGDLAAASFGARVRMLGAADRIAARLVAGPHLPVLA